MARRVAAAVIRALARPQGIQEARAATAKLEATPTPPPQSTKRAKAVKAPGAACCCLCAGSTISSPIDHPTFLMVETLRCVHYLGN